jgi:hypothetical protein
LTAEHKKSEAQTVSVSWLEELTLLQAFGCADLFFQTDAHLVEFGLDFRAYQ